MKTAEQQNQRRMTITRGKGDHATDKFGDVPQYFTEHTRQPAVSCHNYGQYQLDSSIEAYEGLETSKGWIWIHGPTWRALVYVHADGCLSFSQIFGGVASTKFE